MTRGTLLLKKTLFDFEANEIEDKKSHAADTFRINFLFVIDFHQWVCSMGFASLATAAVVSDTLIVTSFLENLLCKILCRVPRSATTCSLLILHFCLQMWFTRQNQLGCPSDLGSEAGLNFTTIKLSMQLIEQWVNYLKVFQQLRVYPVPFKQLLISKADIQEKIRAVANSFFDSKKFKVPINQILVLSRLTQKTHAILQASNILSKTDHTLQNAFSA